MIVDNMVWTFIVLIVEDQLFAQERLGLVVGSNLRLFYADNNVVVSRDTE